MRHIKQSSMWVGLVIILSFFWKGIICQFPAGYSITVPRSVRVQEGLCVTIPCTFTADNRNTFSNSHGYWMLDPPNSNYIVATNDQSRPGRKTSFNLTGNPDSGDCTLTITDARRGDAGIYFYRFEDNKEMKVKYTFRSYAQTTITVTDLTEEPVISDPGIVIAGINKTLTCTPPGNCPATSLVIQWRKSNVAGVWEKSSTVTFTPSLYDDQENITCQMTNPGGHTTQKTILLHVCSPPAITITWEINGFIAEKKINMPESIKVGEGSLVTLRCLLQSNLTLNMTWIDGKNHILQHGIGTELELRLGKVTMNHTGTYTCSALTKYVLNVTSINIIVLYYPSFINKEDTKVCRAVDSIIIIGIVIGNIVAFILINVASYFFLKRHMEKRQSGNGSPDPTTQDMESTYQELTGQKTDIYCTLKAR